MFNKNANLGKMDQFMSVITAGAIISLFVVYESLFGQDLAIQQVVIELLRH
ncbi:MULTISPECIES: hypothetical protein [Shewanella]|uniref:Uncharacterized protein n=1 Tax=Shewanella insulae TaxID=2681496 RepID=A0A6L7I4L2_9GAMM|nr:MULTISPECIES: hypothetical protein [Shewanella]MXR70301.1 hypothetical protein [Shewanella insulae]QYJ89996.1 hypothetical protein K0H81_19945 [Shewanella halotolerans]